MSAILCFSTVDWDFLWYPPQALMSRFAQDGYSILYVDTLGLRSPRPRDLPRILSRLRHGLKARGTGLWQPAAGICVYSPLLLPFLNSRLVCRLNVRYLVPRLQRYLELLGAEEVILWIYLPTWTVLQCVRQIPHRLLVYEAIDALASNPAGVSLNYEIAEREILQQADLVIATSESLYQEKAAHNPKAHWAPPGVAEYFFAEGEVAAEVAEIPGPRIGFFGSLDHRLDLKLMKYLAQAHREWSFVLIGAARGDIQEVLAEANVHFLGPKGHQELPGYLRGLDVLFLPYVIDEFTRHVYPAKIFECLALGQPVVATALPSLSGFGQVIRLAADWKGFEQALEEAVAEDDPPLRKKRVELARENSWEKRYQQIRRYVEDALAD